MGLGFFENCRGPCCSNYGASSRFIPVWPILQYRCPFNVYDRPGSVRTVPTYLPFRLKHLIKIWLMRPLYSDWDFEIKIPYIGPNRAVYRKISISLVCYISTKYRQRIGSRGEPTRSRLGFIFCPSNRRSIPAIGQYFGAPKIGFRRNPRFFADTPFTSTNSAAGHGRVFGISRSVRPLIHSTILR